MVSKPKRSTQTIIQKNDEHMDSFLRALANVKAFKEKQAAKNKDKNV